MEKNFTLLNFLFENSGQTANCWAVFLRRMPKHTKFLWSFVKDRLELLPVLEVDSLDAPDPVWKHTLDHPISSLPKLRIQIYHCCISGFLIQTQNMTNVSNSFISHFHQLGNFNMKIKIEWSSCLISLFQFNESINGWYH